MNNFSAFTMNYKVLVVLIESGYCQQLFNLLDKDGYPKFLITVLKECDKIYIKQAVCRMIIKYFGKKKKDDAAGAGPASG